MTLKTAKYVFLSVCGLMVVLFLVGFATQNPLFILLGVAMAFLGLIWWAAFGRCQHCGKFLGRVAGKYCPHCGAKLEW